MNLDAPGPAVYELVVAGELGPVLRAALMPHRTTRTQPCTVFRTALPADRDLVDLVLILRSGGLEVEGVYRVAEAG